MGGIDWAGLPLVCGLLEVTDVEALLARIQVIRSHEPPQQASASPKEE